MHNNPQALQEFNKWISFRLAYLSQQILTTATSMDQIYGFRYMYGEWEALRVVVNQGLIEQGQLMDLQGEHDDGGRATDGSDDDDEWY